MHPDDVEELVAGQFAELERMVGDRPELRVKQATREGSDIFLTLTMKTNASEVVPLHVAVDLAGPKKLLLPGETRLFGVPQSVPILGQATVRNVILHVGCDGFNGRPPSARLLRPDRSPLPDAEWPREPAEQGVVQAHPVYKRKFFCRPGLREFHELDQHADHPWDAIREQQTIAWIVTSLLGEIQTRWTMA